MNVNRHICVHAGLSETGFGPQDSVTADLTSEWLRVDCIRIKRVND